MPRGASPRETGGLAPWHEASLEVPPPGGIDEHQARTIHSAVVASARQCAAQSDDGDVVEVWSGVQETAIPARADPARRMVRLSSLPQSSGSRKDIQYGHAERYLGVPLGVLFEASPAAATSDTALLHFANGMSSPSPCGMRPRSSAWTSSSPGASGRAWGMASGDGTRTFL